MMTILGPDIVEVWAIVLAKTLIDMGERLAKENSYVLPNFILTTYEWTGLCSLVLFHHLRNSRRVIIAPHKLPDKISPLITWRFESAAGYCARNEMELRWSNRSFPGEAIYGGVGVGGVQRWDAKTFYSCGEVLIEFRKSYMYCRIWRVQDSFWYRKTWERGELELVIGWQKSCLKIPGPASRLASCSDWTHQSQGT
jgi:hypothetical protein